MRLLETYVYTDAAGHTWKAPKDAEIDGASIPRPLWAVVGGPFEGHYRKASVVHDVACELPHGDPWRSVHRMFYEAMRCAGVTPLRAKVMYAAVFHFGPRWGDDEGSRAFADRLDPHSMRKTAAQMTAYLRQKPNLNLIQLEELTPAELDKWHPHVDAHVVLDDDE